LEKKLRPELADIIKVHPQPLRRPNKASILAAFVEIDPSGSRTWEQLWATKSDETGYELCCIPFYAVGLALGDSVMSDQNYVVTGVKCPSGNRTSRILFGQVSYGRRLSLLEEVKALDGSWEFYNETLCGLSVPSESFEKTFDLLVKCSNSSELHFETANAGHQVYVLPTKSLGLRE
jgi:Domain of unknown function (DUF4265)